MTIEEAIQTQHELCDERDYMQDFNKLVLSALRAQQEHENLKLIGLCRECVNRHKDHCAHKPCAAEPTNGDFYCGAFEPKGVNRND